MRTRKSLSLASLTALALGGVLVAGTTPALAAHGTLTVTGLTQNDRLVTFLANDPGRVLSEVRVTGVRGTLQSIDFRPATGALYGVGVTGKRGTLYTIDPATGVATAVPGAPVLPVRGNVSIDVNPAADALRVVDDQGTNLRLSFATNALFVDGDLAYLDSDRNAGTPATIGSIAYTNNLSRTGTTLYDLDAAIGQLAKQDPPNDGGLVSIGDLPQDSRVSATGFDIYEREAARGGQTWAFVTLTDRGRTTFYEIDLATGKAKFFAADPADPASGTAVGSRPAVTDIAVQPAQGV